MNRHRIRDISLTALLVCSWLMASCAGYSLRGKVIEGDVSFASIVGADDGRLTGPGVPGVKVSLETDPGRIQREFVGEAVTDADGDFAIRVRRPGAGFLIYDVGLDAHRDGYEGVRQIFRLPGSSKRVLIVLNPGRDTFPEREETPMEMYDRFKHH